MNVIRGIECAIIRKPKVCEIGVGVIKAVAISAVSYREFLEL